MTKKSYIFILLAIVALTGCSIFQGEDTRAKPVIAAKPKAMPEGTAIANAARIKEGGRIFIGTFKAGAGVEVNSESDQVSLLLMKGIADTFEADSTVSGKLTIVSDAKLDKPDFILSGYITQCSSTGAMKKMMLQGKKLKLAVKAKLVDAKTGDILAHFSEQESASAESHGILGQRIGIRIGKIITGIFK